MESSCALASSNAVRAVRSDDCVGEIGSVSQLMEAVEKKTEAEIATYLRDKQEEAEAEASSVARNIILF